VPWVAARDGPTIEEVCRRFDVKESELLADLRLLFMCGVYPFTPDVLVDVDISAGRVWIKMADWFRRPLRLTPREGLALVSAGSALLHVGGAESASALASGLAKLEAVLGVGADDSFEVDPGEVPAPLLDALRQGVEERRKVLLDYYSFGRDGRSSRVVHPWQLFSSSGNWYLRAWCESAGGERLFRADRVIGAEVLEETVDLPPPRAGHPTASVFHPRPDDQVVVLDLDPPAHWVASQYPNEGVEALADEVLRVTLRISQRAFLERILLRAGPHARVVSGASEAQHLAPQAAQRILARYRRQQSVQ
jgi:proteasome accessory factor C